MAGLDFLRRWADGGRRPDAVMARSDPDDGPSAAMVALLERIEERRASFGLAQAHRMPPVVRARMLICGLGAAFMPLVYRNGAALVDQPRIARRPDPWQSRFAFLYQTIDSMIDHGVAVWLRTEKDDAGYPRSVMVLPYNECSILWDERRFQRRVQWRGRELVPGVDCELVDLGRPAGELVGMGPLTAILPYLAPVWDAEVFAEAWFTSGGVPETVLTSDQKISAAEADAIKRRWLDVRTGPEPAVLGQGLAASWPNVDPERAQLHQSRSYGATIVARGLGIPGALLHVETTGATITYSNPEGAVDDLVKSTIAPMYLTPIEQTMSDLMPGPQVVRFDLNDLSRVSLRQRAEIYQILIDAGVMDSAEARQYEGWSPTETEAPHTFDSAGLLASGEPSIAEVPIA